MNRIVSGISVLLTSISSSVIADVNVSEIKYLEFPTAGAVVARSEETGYLVRQFGRIKYDSSGFEIINTRISFDETQIKQEVYNSDSVDPQFFVNYPNRPDTLVNYSQFGLSETSTNAKYLDVATELLAAAEARLRGSEVILSSGEGYISRGVAGKYFVIAKGEIDNRTVYRCNLDNISSNIDEYVDTCDSVITNQNDAGVGFNDDAYTRYVNDTGYIVYPPSSGSNNYSLVYPDGSTYYIAQGDNEGATEAIYITDGSLPVLHYAGQVFNLTDTGPVIDSSRTVTGNKLSLIAENKDYNYYLSVFDTGLEYEVPKYVVCEKNATLSPTVGSNPRVLGFTVEDAKNFLIETEAFGNPSVIDVIRSYPLLPSNASLTDVGNPFYADMPLTEYQEILKGAIDDVSGPALEIDGVEERMAAESLDLFCSVKAHTGRFGVSDFTPLGLLSDTGIYATPVGFFANSGYFLKSQSDGNGISIYTEVAEYMMSNLSEANKNALLDNLISTNKLFKSYPGYSENSLYEERKDIAYGADYSVTLEEAIDHKRAVMILNALGNEIEHSLPLLGKDGKFTFGIGSKNTSAWILESKVNSNSSLDVEISISSSETTIDPYSDQTGQFSIDVSGEGIYGLDVSCNLSSSSLSITEANYNSLFSSKNSMSLPLIYDATSVTATETLIAPELSFSGSGSFVLSDIIAEFTTEDVKITCAAEISDENGQLMQVALTPATIRIDDGVHGGSGSVSGVIYIPGVADLSGVEVVLTIDGRQVTVITDESGSFEFDGLRNGDFTISLASENYVQSCQAANVTEGGEVELGLIELLAGDINADGNIDIADFTFMAARYRSNQGDADYDAKADLNRDGTINIQDLAILGSHFGSTQCNL